MKPICVWIFSVAMLLILAAGERHDLTVEQHLRT